MALNKQISPVIRISQGERDASARATHLEAASEKYSETTIERKQMSTTTNFKRIALVAVASLGLGVLSSVPAQATINADNLTLSSATAAQTTAETYTATSAIATMTFFGAVNDSVTVTAALISAPAGNTALPVLRLVETSSAFIDSPTYTGGFPKKDADSITANVAANIRSTSATAAATAKFAVYLATVGTTITAPATAGTYVVKLTPAAVGVGPLVGATAQTLTITVTTAATQSTVASAATSTAYMWEGESVITGATADSIVSTVRTVSTANNPAGTIYVTLKNAAGTAAGESITATVAGVGILGTGSSAAGTDAFKGRSINVKMGDFIGVFADGSAGTATVTLSTMAGAQIGTAKTVTFTSTTMTSIGAPTIKATESSVILAGTTTNVWAFAKDGTNNVSGLTTASAASGTTIWAYSSDTSVATVAAVAAYDAEYGYAALVTGVAVGTTSISFGNASTLAAATIKSTPITVRVGTAVPASVKVTTDKATYAPGEKITLTVTILNGAGLPVVGKTTYAGIFAESMTTSMTLSGTANLPGADISNYSDVTNTKTFTNYAPVTGGNLTFSWKGGTGLLTANQVAGSLTVTVADSGAANAAAIASLQTAVASLRTLLVTLTNLVLKIQKKVRA
jgi:hypothetical protein